MPHKNIHLLIPEPVNVSSQGERNLADGTKVRNLEMGRLPYFMWVGSI